MASLAYVTTLASQPVTLSSKQPICLTKPSLQIASSTTTTSYSSSPSLSSQSSTSSRSQFQGLALASIPFSTYGKNAVSGSPTYSRILMWFQSDLRVQDNEALNEAVKGSRNPNGCLINLYCGSAATKRVHHAAASELRANLISMGSDMVVLAKRSGKDLAVKMIEMCREFQIQAVYMNYSVLKDDVEEQTVVIQALEEASIQVVGFWGNSLCANQAFKELSLKEVSRYVSDATNVAKPGQAPRKIKALPENAAKFSDLDLAPTMGRGTSFAMSELSKMDAKSQALNVSRAHGEDYVWKLKAALDCGALSLRMAYAKIVEVMNGEARGYLFSELAFRSYVCALANKNKKAAAVHA